MIAPTIVVPLDASGHALVALPVAKQLAELQGATLHLVHVAHETSPPADVLDRLGLNSMGLRGSVLDTKAGEPSFGIVQAGRELQAALIVMCTHTAVSGADKTLGTTALAVLRHAPCPVVLVRPERGVVPWALHRILLPHDGTPTTSAAIRPAAELARRARVALDVLHVAALGAPPPGECGSLTPPLYMDQPQHEWPAWAGEFLGRLGGVSSLESLNVRMFLARGRPGDEALRFAAEHASDLIVLAWRGEWEGAHAATLKTVVRGATAPVLVIRARE
jgi:nucleotide-binding universal stress UspA family protein